MEFLRHPLYSILAVILIGAACGAAARWFASRSRKPLVIVAMLAGIGAAFLGFHFAMLSNLATDVILMPFAISLVIALLASVAMARM